MGLKTDMAQVEMVFGTNGERQCNRCICHKKYCIWQPAGSQKKSCNLCSYHKVVCTIKKGVRVCNRKSKVGKGKKPSKRAWVEDLEPESVASGVGPSVVATLRDEQDRQTELLMGLKEGYDCTNELLVGLKESSDWWNALLEQQNALLGAMVRRFDSEFVDVVVDSTMKE